MTATTTRRSVAQRQPAPAHPNQALATYVERHRDQMLAALPKHLTPERMLRLATTSINGSAKLRQCSPDSVIAAVVTASQLGLEIGVGGQAFLVPYKVDNQYRAQLIPGWQGLIDLVARAGKATAWTGAVYQGDAFDFELSSAPYLRHKPLGPRDPAGLQFVYAVGRVKDAEHPIIEAWPIEQVWQHRDQFNRQGGDHYSVRHPEMYARKVVLLQVIKYLPRSVQLIEALDLSAADDGISALRGEFTVLDGGGDAPPENALAEVLEAISEAGTPEQLDALRHQIDALPSSQRKHAEAAASIRAATLEQRNAKHRGGAA
ncbi:MAG: recombinase RecT [Reyranellaceae bacterium]